MSEHPQNERWFIDLKWHKENDCSLFAVAQDYLCPRCRRKFKKEIEEPKIIETISSCCSQKPGFFKVNTPILTMVFRTFLANSNQPLDLEELAGELARHRGEFSPVVSPQTLSRLLKSDRYYGLRPAPKSRSGAG